MVRLETAMPTNLPHRAARVSPVQLRRGSIAQGIIAQRILAQGIMALAILALALCGLLGVWGSIAPHVRDALPQPRPNQYHGEYSPAEVFKRYPP